MTRPAARALALVALAFVAACGSGGSNVRATRAQGSQTASATATLTIPNAARPASARRAQYVSAATAWITLAVDAGAALLFDASASSTACAPVTNGRTCTFTFAIPSATTATHVIAVKAYDANPIPGPANLLSQSTLSLNVVAGAANVALPLTLNGTVASATVTVPAGPLQFEHPASVPVAVTTKDAAGNTIVGNAPFDGSAAIAIGVNAPQGTLTLTPLNGTPVTGQTVNVTSPSDSVTLNYPGATSVTLGVTVFATLVRPPAAPVALAPAVLPLIVGNSSIVTYNPRISSGTRIARGPDGSVYYVAGSNSGIGRVAFVGATPAFSTCTEPNVIDVAVTPANVVLYVVGGATTIVKSLPVAAFLNGAPCGGATQTTLPPTATSPSIAANASGAFASYLGVVTTGSDHQIVLETFGPNGAQIGTDTYSGHDAAAALLYGDPAVASAALVGQTFVSSTMFAFLLTTGPPGIAVVPPAGQVTAPDSPRAWTFGFDPAAGTIGLLNAASSPSLLDIVTPAGTATQIGGSASLNAGIPLFSPDHTNYIGSSASVLRFDVPTGQYVSTVLTNVGSVTGGVLAADNRFWMIDPGFNQIVAFPN